MHCPGHERDSLQMSQGNQAANSAARQAARGLPWLGVLIPSLDLSKFKLHYMEQDKEQAHEGGFTNTDLNSM